MILGTKNHFLILMLSTKSRDHLWDTFSGHFRWPHPVSVVYVSDRGTIDLSFEPSIGPIGWETQKLWRVKVHEFCQNVQDAAIIWENLRKNLGKFLIFFKNMTTPCTFWQNSWTLTLHNFCVSQPIGPIEDSNERSIVPLSDTYHTYRMWSPEVTGKRVSEMVPRFRRKR